MFASGSYEAASGSIDAFVWIASYAALFGIAYLIFKATKGLRNSSTGGKSNVTNPSPPTKASMTDIADLDLKNLPKPMLGSGYPKVKSWNRDPSGKAFERYWDGDNWTSQTRDKDWKKKAKTSKDPVIKTGTHQGDPSSRFVQKTKEIEETPPHTNSQNLSAELEILSDLFSKGHLSEDEFSKAKKRILG
jgi:hypothetical protein